MKVRTNYVSNSSSSSFVFAYDNDAALKVKGRKNAEKVLTIDDFFDLVEAKGNNWCSDGTEIVARGRDNVIDYFDDKETWSYSEDYAKEMLEKVKKCKRGNVAVIRMEYDDRITRKLFELFKETGEILELDSSED